MKFSTGIVIVICILIGGTLAACAGFDFGDVVKVDTPLELQQTHGYPAKMSLNQAKDLYPAWFEDTQRNGAQWKGDIERADAMAGMFRQLTLQQLNELGPMIAGIPALGPAAPVATGILGILVASMRTRREKEKSFNKGLEMGAQTATNPYAQTQPGAVITGASFKG